MPSAPGEIATKRVRLLRARLLGGGRVFFEIRFVFPHCKKHARVGGRGRFFDYEKIPKSFENDRELRRQPPGDGRPNNRIGSDTF